MGDINECKRKADWDLLIRVDENVKSIKQTLDEYPLPVINEKLIETTKKIDKHIAGHSKFWVSVVIPVGIAFFTMLITIATIYWKGR